MDKPQLNKIIDEELEKNKKKKDIIFNEGVFLAVAEIVGMTVEAALT